MIKRNLIKRFSNTYESCDGDINKFILLLRKGLCSYEQLGKFDYKLLPKKITFTVV